MGRIKDFFTRVVNHITGVSADTKKAAEDLPMSAESVMSRHARDARVGKVRMSQRERGFGHERADGRWQSPFDIWLARQRGMTLTGVRRIYGRKGVDWAMARRSVAV